MIKQVLQPGRTEEKVTCRGISERYAIEIESPTTAYIRLSLWRLVYLEHNGLSELLIVEVDADKIGPFGSQRKTNYLSEGIGNIRKVFDRTCYPSCLEKAVQVCCLYWLQWPIQCQAPSKLDRVFS